MKNWIVVDVEADGPCPGLYSMVCFGAVPVADTAAGFYGETAPVSDDFVADALAVSGFSRQQHQAFPAPEETMHRFADWLEQFQRPVFWSDNPAFDWQWINYYLHRFVGRNPFGFSARRIGDLYAGLRGDPRDATSWKRLRKTRHDHNPLHDARGNAEALRAILSQARR